MNEDKALHPATLYLHRREHVSLADAVQAFSAIAPTAVALLYSPRSCDFARLSSGALLGSTGSAVELAVVFKARIFCRKAELRWLNDPKPEGRHRAVILAEEDLSSVLGAGWGNTTIEAIDTVEQTYLLWGEGTGNPMSAGWSQLGAARIGALAVPISDVGKHQRVLLETCEYCKPETDHGNVVVRAERLCGLVPGKVEHG